MYSTSSQGILEAFVTGETNIISNKLTLTTVLPSMLSSH